MRDISDTGFSEKARIPAWTDRILRKGTNLRQLAYNSAPLRFSDHRPVYAIFECTVNIVDEVLRDKISREVYERRKSEIGGDTANLAAGESEDEDLIGYDAIEPGLPPASSDRQKWWLENGKMARSSISPPKPDNPAYQTILNPKRPANPHVPTEEPDWVSVPRSESRLSSFSSMSTSPYEHVNHSMLLSSSVSSSAARKLPPPYDPSALPAKVGRLQISEDKKGSQSDKAPPPPPPRRQTSVEPVPASNAPAHSAQTKRKPVDKVTPSPPVGPKPIGHQQHQDKQRLPPPVAKKPAHLASPSSPASSSPASFVSDTTVVQGGSGPSPPDLPRRSTSSMHGSFNNILDGTRFSSAAKNGIPREEPPPPQTPRRANTSAGAVTQSRMAAAGGIPLVGLAPQERRPQLPGRKPTATVPAAAAEKQAPAPPAPRKTAPAVDLLGDDGAAEMRGWEALKPS